MSRLYQRWPVQSAKKLKRWKIILVAKRRSGAQRSISDVSREVIWEQTNRPKSRETANSSWFQQQSFTPFPLIKRANSQACLSETCRERHTNSSTWLGSEPHGSVSDSWSLSWAIICISNNLQMMSCCWLRDWIVRTAAIGHLFLSLDICAPDSCAQTSLVNAYTWT